jgi:hypothetical protein
MASKALLPTPCSALFHDLRCLAEDMGRAR